MPKQIPFVPGLVLAEGFYQDAVKPILASHYPDLRYSAALIGSGSEVLGFDNEMSRDHHWGPRVMLFLSTDDFKVKRDAIRSALSTELPPQYRGYSTNFAPPDPSDHGTQMLRPVTAGPINHRVEIHTFGGFFRGYLNIDIEKPLSPVDWLTLPQQKLRTIIAGRVFHDDLDLESIRSSFAWYPGDVWLYILAALWARIGQEEHLMGRAGDAGDENGSAIIGARIARDIMRLAFLMEKQYPPYAKWFGTAFRQLKCAAMLEPVLTNVLHAESWQEREAGLSTACEIIAELHNTLGITEPVAAQVSPFFSRPFKIIWGEKIALAIVQQIKDPEIMTLTKRSLIGSIDIISDNTDVLEDVSLRPMLKAFYQ
jgi:Domain of unknown function (DUF4037)